MRLTVIGLDYSVAPVEMREKLSFSRNEAVESGVQLVKTTEIKEAMIISTCNRVELFVVAQDNLNTRDLVVEFLSSVHNIDASLFSDLLYVYHNKEAVHHIFSVTSALESMVVGETQIRGQIKHAFLRASAASTTGAILNHLCYRALAVARNVQQEMNLSKHPVSIASASVELAKSVFPEMLGSRALVIGTGKMARLIVQELRKNRVKDIAVFSRSDTRAIRFADTHETTAEPMFSLCKELKTSDIVFFASGTTPIMLRELELTHLSSIRKTKPLFIIDIAVPRSVECNADEFENIHLYDIDALVNVPAINTVDFKAKLATAKKIIESASKKHSLTPSTKEISLVIKELVSNADALVASEVARIESREITKEDLHELGHRIVKKMLHNPLRHIRSLVDEGRVDEARDVAINFKPPHSPSE